MLKHLVVRYEDTIVHQGLTLITVITLILQNHANFAFDADAMNVIVANTVFSPATLAGMMHMWMQFNHILQDIIPEEEAQPISFIGYKHPRINNLSDTEAKKMIGFYHGQLVRLYRGFELERYLISISDDRILLYTGHWTMNSPCRYLVRGGILVHIVQGPHRSNDLNFGPRLS